MSERVLKPCDSAERNVLPTAADLAQEKTHQGILTGIAGFQAQTLKPTETKEKVVLPGQQEIQAEKTIQGVLQVSQPASNVLLNCFLNQHFDL